MLPWDDVFNMQRGERRIVLMRLAILATVASASPDLPLHPLIHPLVLVALPCRVESRSFPGDFRRGTATPCLEAL